MTLPKFFDKGLSKLPGHWSDLSVRLLAAKYVLCTGICSPRPYNQNLSVGLLHCTTDASIPITKFQYIIYYLLFYIPFAIYFKIICIVYNYLISQI